MKRAYYMALVAVVCAVGCGSGAPTSAHYGEVGVDVVWSVDAPVAALGDFVDKRHRLEFATRDASEFRWMGHVRWTMNSGGELVIAHVDKTVWGNTPRAHFYGWRNPLEPGGSPRPVFEYEMEGIGAVEFKATFIGKSFVVRVRDGLGGWGEVVRVSSP